LSEFAFFCLELLGVLSSCTQSYGF
jgi:hypothetical protein